MNDGRPVLVGMSIVDAAGVLFYPELFRLAHDAYESMMADLGAPLSRLLEERQWALPIVHAEADFHRPIHHGDRLILSVIISEISQRSFRTRCRFENGDGVLCGEAVSVHVCINRDTGRSESLPPALLDVLRRAVGD